MGGSTSRSPSKEMKKEQEVLMECLEELKKEREEMEKERTRHIEESTKYNMSIKSDRSKEHIFNINDRPSALSPDWSGVSFPMSPGYRPTFSHGLSANVRSPLLEWLKERTRTSDSDESTTSNVSIKSDQSKEDIINFRETLSPPRSDTPGVSMTMERYRSTLRHELSANVLYPEFPLKRSASTGSICLSSKRDHCKERKRNKSLLRL